MATEKDKEKEWEERIERKFENWCSSESKKSATCHGSSGAVWFLGFIGAVIYYIQTANNFWDGIVGFLKAIVWPAFLVYEALKVLAM
ncbi:hypothetical protein C4544_02895 [candidate division WS5 bacterium]|uniref:Uncharacterized protein n=1 Tax=candidate division WS5 bacterium TaxID=2093353 RepID=A0A419DED2_9BACT|nr:MAG: hypothetical protein C4544_02895 [candidate division WS5 bacterium]